MKKKNCSTRGVIFEANSKTRIFAFVKCEFKDFAFDKCDVSAFRNVFGQKKNHKARICKMRACELSSQIAGECSKQSSSNILNP